MSLLDGKISSPGGEFNRENRPFFASKRGNLALALDIYIEYCIIMTLIEA
jgi:hypothetical protein